MIVLVLFVGPGFGLAQAHTTKPITATFDNTELTVALNHLAKEIGADLVLGPSVRGRVTTKLEKVSLEDALRRILSSQQTQYEFKLVSDQKLTLVVAAPDMLARLCEMRSDDLTLEYFLDEAVSAKVIDFLKGEYPNVGFAPHPTMNGFFALGSKEDLLQIKRELAHLDRVPPPPAPPQRAYLPEKYAELQNVRGTLSAPPAESYQGQDETPFREVTVNPLSTFSIDVDTASYANVRRFLNTGQLPPPAAVRVEEFLNYFSYDYPQPEGNRPFSLTTELSDCPWNERHQLLRVGLQGRRAESKNPPPRNLVFLIDVSGSMNDENKLPLVKSSMKMLLSTLRAQDRVAIVVYAGGEGLHLPSTTCDQKELIADRIDVLGAGGSTNGAGGIQLAYKVARESFQKNAINRVILCTDGDFNVGLTGGSLIGLIEKERESGIFLSVLGFGTGNIKDDTLEGLADHGNGNYSYIASFREAQKVLVREAESTFLTIAKDVKLQVEFNPKQVHSYRLIGYENRRLENEDFENDKKDAGELGAGHTVTALYELAPVGNPSRSALRYQNRPTTTAAANGKEMALVKLRYKTPEGTRSRLREYLIVPNAVGFENASQDMRFAASVAAFGQILGHSEYAGGATFAQIADWAGEAIGEDPYGDRKEFLALIELAASLPRNDEELR